MQLKHSFTVPVPIDEAWRVLLDLERIVPALPGASLGDHGDDTFTGQVKVKIGSIQMAYKGQGTFTERNEADHRIVIEAAGKDARGAGTAQAAISCTLSPDGPHTRADVVTDLALTGRPAQFGRGLVNDVGGKILDQFAVNLSAALQADSAPQAAAPEMRVGGTPAASGEARPIGGAAAAASTPPRAPVTEAEPLDLMSVAGAALAKRAAAVGVVVLALVVGLLIGRRSSR